MLLEPLGESVKLRQWPGNDVGLAIELACVDEQPAHFFGQARQLVKEPLHLPFVRLPLEVHEQLVPQPHVNTTERLKIVDLQRVEQLVTGMENHGRKFAAPFIISDFGSNFDAGRLRIRVRA